MTETGSPIEHDQRIALEAGPQRLAIEPSPQRPAIEGPKQPSVTTHPDSVPPAPGAEPKINFPTAPPDAKTDDITTDHKEEETSDTPLSPERHPLPENVVIARGMLTEPRGRMLAFSADVDPDTILDEEEAKNKAEEAIAKGTEGLPQEALAEHSVNSRREAWKTSDKSLADKAADWRNGLANWINEKTDLQKEEPPKTTPSEREAIIASFHSLGVDISKKDTLDAQLETFRQEYVGAEENDSQEDLKKRAEEGLEKFAQKLADGCREGDDGAINLAKLDTKLQAMSELFIIFGKDKAVDQRVRDYAADHAMLKVKDEGDDRVGTALTEKMAEHLQHPLPEGDDKESLKDLYNTHKDLQTKHDIEGQANDTHISSEEQAPEENDSDHSATSHEAEDNMDEAADKDKTKDQELSRLQGMKDKLLDFLHKSHAGKATQDDIEAMKPILEEYTKEIDFLKEEDFKKVMGGSKDDSEIQEIIEQIQAFYSEKNPAFYVIRLLGDEKNYTITEPVEENRFFLHLMTDPHIKQYLRESTPSTQDSDA